MRKRYMFHMVKMEKKHKTKQNTGFLQKEKKKNAEKHSI